MSERTTQRGDGEVGVCHVCGERFDTQEALAEHLMRSHEDDLLGSEEASDASGTRSER